jgi:glycosyltransferase involved in cell wall biosynthesis
LIRDGKNGFLVEPPKKNPEPLYQALDRLLSDLALRSYLGRNGTAIVANEYSVSTFQQTLERIVTQLLG